MAIEARKVLASAIAFHQGDVEELVKKVEGSFVVDNDAMAMWLIVERPEERVVAHLLATDDLYGGRKVAFVLQLAAEPRSLPREHIQTCGEELRAWARSREATRILMLTRRARLGAWRRLFGFVPYRLLMQMEL